jgi:hypothetical protein
VGRKARPKNYPWIKINSCGDLLCRRCRAWRIQHGMHLLPWNSDPLTSTRRYATTLVRKIQKFIDKHKECVL